MHNTHHSYSLKYMWGSEAGIAKNSMASSNNGRLGNRYQLSHWKLEKLGKTKVCMLSRQWKITGLWRSRLTQVSLAFGVAFPIGPSTDGAVQNFRVEQNFQKTHRESGPKLELRGHQGEGVLWTGLHSE